MISINKPKLLAPLGVFIPLLLALWTTALRSQPCCVDPRWSLLQIQSMATEFQRLQTEFRASRDRERRNVPIYNARLNGVVIAFHKHITKDNHYLVANCGLCRKHLAQIRSYSKKLDQAMK
jgi:hypothetical protein